MHEKRQHNRITISTEVNLSSKDNFYAGAARDMSVGGLYVETEIGLPIGSEVTALLRLPSKVLSLKAEVVWSVTTKAQTVGMGLRFVNLPAPAKREIEAFMQVRQPIGFAVDEVEEEELDETPKSQKGPPPLPAAPNRRK